MESAAETRQLPRETLDAIEALERLVRRHGAVSEPEGLVALRALVPDDTPATLDEAFAIAHAARPPRPPREEMESAPRPRRGRAPRPAEGEAPAPEAPPAEQPAADAAPAEPAPADEPKSE